MSDVIFKEEMVGRRERVTTDEQPIKLTVWKVIIERVIVVKFRVNYGSGYVLAVLKSRYGWIQRSSRM